MHPLENTFGTPKAGGLEITPPKPSVSEPKPAVSEPVASAPKETADPVPAPPANETGTAPRSNGREKMATGASVGHDPTPQSIHEGSVRMEEHPQYQAVVDDLKAQGFEVRFTEGDPHVVSREVVDKAGNFVRVDRFVNVRKGMRFLDLEHEVGHVDQLTQRFGDTPLLTERKVLLPNGNLKDSRNVAGVLTQTQNDITEHHNRLVEWLRLYKRGVNPEVLSEHTEGVEEYASRYFKRVRGGGASSAYKWAETHFGDIKDLENQYKQAVRELSSR